MALKRNKPAAKEEAPAEVNEAAKKTEEALNKTNTNTPAAAVAPVEEKAKVEETTQAPAQEEAKEKPAADVPATREAAAPPSANAVLGKGLLYQNAKDFLVVDFGTLPRLKASNGNILDQDDKVLGTWIETELISFNSNWAVTPNDDGAPNELTKFSKNNETIDDDPSLTVAAHIADLKAQGYANASSKEYYEVVCQLLASEKDSPHVGELVQLQLSPTSKKGFESFRLQQTFKATRGNLTPEQVAFIKWTTELTTSKRTGKTWTKFVPHMTALG